MKERPAGVEPARPPWQGDRLPLHHGRFGVDQIVKDQRAPGGTRTLVTALRVRCPCRWTTSACFQVGPVGIEPTSSGLRDRRITLSATVPLQSARWELNPRPASYKDAALTAELRATASRAGGNRTRAPTRSVGPAGLKVRCAASYTTTPNWPCVSVSIAVERTSCSPRSSVVRGGLEPTTSDSSDRHASFTTPDLVQSGRWDSNPRSRVPKTRGLAAALHPDCFVSQNGRI